MRKYKGFKLYSIADLSSELKALNQELHITDYTKLKKVKSTDNTIDYFSIRDTKYKLCDYEKSNKKVLGYLMKENDGTIYVYGVLAAKRRWPILLLILFIYLPLLLSGEKGNSTLDDILLIGTFEGDDWSGRVKDYDKVQEEELIEFIGFGELTLSEENPYLYLGNPKSNDVIFKYEVYKDGGLLFKTELIKPGKAVKMNILEYLDISNEYKLLVKTLTYDKLTLEPLQGLPQYVTIYIK